MSYEKYKTLSESYPTFIYESYEIEDTKAYLNIVYAYKLLGTEETFHHRIRVHKNFKLDIKKYQSELFENIVFNLGMVEAISYWKATCSQNLIVRPASLNQQQINWWQKLIYNGLGEFMYINGLYDHINKDAFVHIINEGQKTFNKESISVSGNLIPVGGGKDSCVSLELLNDTRKQNKCFVINPIEASNLCIQAAGYLPEDVLTIERQFDTKLFELNKRNFLNGHIPYSAVVAFSALLCAFLDNKKYIILSNENSSNEPSVLGTMINHQYSKSIEFENDFRAYVAHYITSSIEYFSLLRPWSELKIAQVFAEHKKYHKVFISCNRGGKANKWCCQCPKCLFVYLILFSYLDIDAMDAIFGNRLLENSDLLETFQQLIGLKDVKPFECVGTINEVKQAVQTIIKKKYDNQDKTLPILLQYYCEHCDINENTPVVMVDREHHHVPSEFLTILFEDDSNAYRRKNSSNLQG